MILDRLTGNYIEILGVISSLIYLYFSVRQKIWLWPLGILSSGLFLYVFYAAGFYADMSLQGYYLVISVYGWYHWIHGGEDKNRGQLPVTRLSMPVKMLSLIVFAFLFIGMALLLDGLTDSDVPWGDSFTTAGSIIATWMLARKILEHWLIWIVIDLMAAGLYLYKGLYPTAFLYLVYAAIAGLGFYQWKKSIDK